MLTHMRHCLSIWEYGGVKFRRLEELKCPKDKNKDYHHQLMLWTPVRVNTLLEKTTDHALELQETVSLPLSYQHATHTLLHYLSLGRPKSVIKQLEMGSSLTTAIDKKRTIDGSLENIYHSKSAHVFNEQLTFKQFKLKYGRSRGRPASISTIPIAEICQAVTPTKETKEMDSIKTTISSDSRSAFTEYA